MGRELNSVTRIIAEKASTPYTDIITIPVSIPGSLTSLSEVPRLQKSKQMCWNGELEEEERLNCQWQEATVECALIACWYL